MNNKSFILVTGAAGFIGAALSGKLLSSGENVIGIDDLNSYYDPNLKKARIENIRNNLSPNSGEWIFEKLSINSYESLKKIANSYSINIIINLAAQAGVRYSIENPRAYFESNLLGFGNILELCRYTKIKNFIFASSSSVYGGNKKYPFKESDLVDHPVSLYASTKKANEVMAHSYSHLYNIPSTGLRFFTVYGPWGRPDMAPMIFANSISNSKPINIFNYGDMKRDFTYIEDVVETLFLCSKKPATIDNSFDFQTPNSDSSFAPYRIFNVGNSQPVNLLNFIEVLENELNIKAKKNFIEMQPGDVQCTSSDIDNIKEWIGFSPSTPLNVGIKEFAKWYKSFYKI
tara:strand:- start:714 stop:1748 length:1035 start_codon:yes stop_codon:yes gene_type:complete